MDVGKPTTSYLAPQVGKARLQPSVSQLKSTVTEQLDQAAFGGASDANALRESLMQLTTQARQLRPLNPKTPEDKQKAKDVAHLHGLACRAASYASFMASGLPANLSQAAAETHLKSMQVDLAQTVDRTFGSSEVSKVSSEIKPPRPDLIEWVEVPAGEFKMGYNDEKAHLETFRIAKYPITNSQFLEFVQSTGYEAEGPFLAPEGSKYPDGKDSLGKHPAPMSYYDLKAFSEWVGGGIPTREQFEKAGRGPDGNKFPWGNSFDPSVCNWDSGATTPVDKFEKPNSEGVANVSYYGAVDMVGNMLEWVDGGAARRPGAVYLKGGAWSNYLPGQGDETAFDLLRETSETPDSKYSGFGGRIVMAGPAPASSKPAVTPLPAEASLETMMKAVVDQHEELNPEMKLLDSEIEKLKRRPAQASPKTLQAMLQDICKETRDARPLSGFGKDIEAKSAADKVLAAANRLSFNAGVVSAGVGPLGMSVVQGLEGMETSFLELRQNLAQVQSTGKTEAISSELKEENPAGIEWVTIPAGKFKYGRDNVEVDMPAYRMAKYPVTKQQFAKFVEATGYRCEGGFKPPADGVYPGGEDSEGDHPVGNVSFYDMQAFAKWATPGGHVPSQQQWEKAARGTEGQAFPWGEDFDPSKVNHDSGGLASVYEMEKRGNVSPFGVVDMVGNSLEWVDDSTPNRPGSTMLKGGAYSNSTGNLKVQSTTRFTTDVPTVGYQGFGGRIAAPVVAE